MLLTFVIFSLTTVTTADKILSAVVIHRHGDRNPFTTYRTDPYSDESHWPEGLGQLTKRGVRRQYDLGLWLNRRYAALLPPLYSPKTIRAVSTDVDRTLMSAELTLAGLYPPLDTEKIDDHLNWQPIPVHTAPTKQDPLLAMKKPCKKYQRMFDSLLTSDHIVEINNINRNLYEFLNNKTGESIEDVYDVEIIFNTLHSQFLANKSLPEWAAEVYPEQMKPAVLLRYKLPCYSKELARLKTGLLFGEIVANFRRIVENGVSPKVLMFSAHDSTLSDVLTAMGAFNDEVPPYSSAVLMELKRDEEGNYVNLFLKNDTGVFELVLNGCEFRCEFSNFTDVLEPIVVPNVQQWEEECEN